MTRATQVQADASSAPRLRTGEEIQRHFEGWDLNADQRWYLGFNLPRFEFLLATADELLERHGGNARVLDIGPGFQTELLRAVRPGLTVDTLGFSQPLIRPRAGEQHLDFDLNDAVYPDRWPPAGPYELVLLAEVIEHVHTTPAAVLRCVASLMAPGGSLVVQTPNAAALHKRLQLLVGRHPYGPLSDDRTNPMHFREYTAAELRQAGSTAGLHETASALRNYFNRGTAAARAYNALARVLPGNLRQGITMVFERPEVAPKS